MQCEKFEEVIIELAKKNWVPKEISPIEFEEYKRECISQIRIKRLESFRDKIENKPTPGYPKRAKRSPLVISIIVLAVLVALLCYHYFL